MEVEMSRVQEEDKGMNALKEYVEVGSQCL